MIGRKPFSRVSLVFVLVILVVTLTAVWISRFAFAATPYSVTFDFDTGTPALAESQSTPLDQTSNSITAYFSSTSDPAAFSVQSYSTTFFKLSQFSGKYLYDNKPSRDSLDIKFNAPLTSITLTFATIEFHGGPGVEPSNITLTAYVDSTAATPIGAAIARGTWPSGDSYPQGMVTFNSGGQQFNLVKIEVPYQGAAAAVDFLVDNIIIVTTGPSPSPSPSPSPTPSPTPSPSPPSSPSPSPSQSPSPPIPEFPQAIILLVPIVATILAVFLAKKKLPKHIDTMRVQTQKLSAVFKRKMVKA